MTRSNWRYGIGQIDYVPWAISLVKIPHRLALNKELALIEIFPKKNSIIEKRHLLRPNDCAMPKEIIGTDSTSQLPCHQMVPMPQATQMNGQMFLLLQGLPYPLNIPERTTFRAQSCITMKSSILGE
jgi:hypothetical protein